LDYECQTKINIKLIRKKELTNIKQSPDFNQKKDKKSVTSELAKSVSNNLMRAPFFVIKEGRSRDNI